PYQSRRTHCCLADGSAAGHRRLAGSVLAPGHPVDHGEPRVPDPSGAGQGKRTPLMSASPVLVKTFTVHLKHRLLFDIDQFEPVAGTSPVITGTTGSGKSVFLKTLAGLLYGPFTMAGGMKLHGIDAYVDGKKTSLETWRNILHVGLTFVPAETAQAMNPALSLEQNLKIICPEAQDLVERRLKEFFNLDFTRYAKQYPDEVSGGELQRITLMILLSRKADLVLLDEPTVNLDRQ